jgi:glycosyltransferase involved in cell wall biosynthesis
MRVLQVHARYREPGGEDRVVEAEAELLRSAGHEVVQHVVENPAGNLAAAGTMALSAWNPLAARDVRRLAERMRPDVAHVHNTWFALSPSVVRALKQAGAPVLMTLHNYRLLCVNVLLFRDGRPCEDCVGALPWRGVWHRCYRDSAAASAAVAASVVTARASGWARDVDLFLVPSEFARERLVAGGLPRAKLRVKPHFVPDPGPRTTSPSASQMVLYVGRLSVEKGVNVLLEAWRSHAPKSLQLVVVGRGPLEEQLRSLAGSNVQFTGHLDPDEIRRRMLQARSLVFPSLAYETFGLVAVEALAAGLPVLASEGGSVSEVVSGLGSNWLAAASDADAWGRRLIRLADDRAVDVAGALGRRLYEERFSPMLALRNLEDAYQRAGCSIMPR